MELHGEIIFTIKSNTACTKSTLYLTEDESLALMSPEETNTLETGVELLASLPGILTSTNTAPAKMTPKHMFSLQDSQY